ncbi:hypothetical protein DFH11DRAFT_1502400 [Phellopilus nigrolimitatus]|nr:hypothetical protein DFH11DRAFT_1502400 [Phellopilus nigrolimitatus]
MNLEHDKILPPSHIEGAALLPSDPIRFVWDQTTKKSPHNFAMKARVVSDMLASKDLYPLVPAQEFMKTKLDGVFEQAFTTLRQKHVSQKGNGDAASRARERVEHKARRARRISRKKTKLANRLSMRKKLTEYSLTMFDAAFHMDCMSSEESSEEEEDESDEASSDDERPPAHKFLRIRYLAWRSSRLHQLFQTIDARDEQARNAKPKRGIGRKDRRVGLPKDGNPLPPKGVSRWMVSKKWLQEANAVNPGLGELLQEIVKEEGEEEGEDAGKQALATLGPESDDEQQRRAEARQEEYPHTHAQGQMPLPPAMPLPGSDMTPDQYVQQYFLAAQQAQWTDNMETPAGYIDVPDYSPYSAGLPGSS